MASYLLRMNWNATDIPPQQGRLAVVTGTGGLGFETSRALARAGAEVVIAGRDRTKGDAAVARVRAEVPDAAVRFEALDLANLRAVRTFCDRLREQTDRVDVLVNNAAVMTPPARRLTADGFELQLGTNHLGHVALTAGLLPLLRRGRDARVVTVSSVAAREGAIDFDDLQGERSYAPMRAYAQSKLAGLMFAFELQRRSEAQRWGLASIAAHPGIARTELLHNAPGRHSLVSLARSALWFLFQPAPQGALPTLFAATAADATPGGYYGPDRLGETRGHPAPAKVPPGANDRGSAARLWDESARLTGARFE